MPIGTGPRGIAAVPRYGHRCTSASSGDPNPLWCFGHWSPSPRQVLAPINDGGQRLMSSQTLGVCGSYRTMHHIQTLDNVSFQAALPKFASSVLIGLHVGPDVRHSRSFLILCGGLVTSTRANSSTFDSLGTCAPKFALVFWSF